MKDKKQDILQHIKGTGFSVPEDYFNNFENKILKNNNTNTTGFKVPANYFENFEDIVIGKKNLATVKNAGYKVPDNYFTNVETKVFPKVKKEKVIPLKNRSYLKRTILAIAASILLFFSISKINHNKDTTYNTVNDAEIDLWMEEGLVSFNTFEIEAMFSDEDLNLLAEESDEITDYLKYTDIEVLLLEN